MRLISRKWKNLSWFILLPKNKKIERQTCICHVYVFLRSGENEVSPVSLYIFDFISTKCKILYQFLLFARSTRNLTDFLYFFIHIFIPISIMWKNLIDFLYIFIFLFLFRQVVLLLGNDRFILLPKSKK